MKKILTVILYFFYTLLCLILCLIIFLSVYYSKLEKEQIKIEKGLKTKSTVIASRTDSVTNSSREMVLNLIPLPKTVNFTGGHFTFPSTLVYSVSDTLKGEAGEFLKMIPGIEDIHPGAGGNIQFKYVKELKVQGYIIDIKPGKITAEYSSKQGLYYAIVSLKVLKQNYSNNIPCVHIEDYPDLAIRGLMLDVSRDKVPTKETLMGIIQLLSDLKYNHFELYIEGFSFAYPSFKNLWTGKETPVTGEEIQSLDTFCKAHFIDFVPNQNSLGHMTAWLATDQYKPLAECPKGYRMLGLIKTISTLNPADPGSIKLVSEMTDDLLPNFTSPNFNVDLDEPFELGKGKSKELCVQKGIGEVYLDYAKKVHDIVISKNKKMMMWGDIVLRYPELLPKIPQDITLLDWGYESGYPYEKHCKVLQASGLNYMVCPGTNSWATITGRTDNMLANIENATTNGAKYGAKGMLLTDWGDMGHWQYLPVSYAGYTAGAALSWNSKCGKHLNLSRFLNTYVFRDDSSVMGDLVLELGRYNRFEEIPLPNMTTTMMALQYGLRDKILISAIYNKVISGISDLMKDIAPDMIADFKDKYNSRSQFDYKGLNNFIDSQERLLQKAKIGTRDSLLIHDEYQNAIRLLRLGADLQYFVNLHASMTLQEETAQLKSMKELGSQYLDENHRLWLLRNKPGGYEKSTAVLNSLMLQVDNRLFMLKESSLSRGINRFLERIGTAGAVLYLRSAS